MKDGIAAGRPLIDVDHARHLVSRRTRDYLQGCKEAGIRLGRPRSLPAEVVERIVADHERGMTQTAIAASLNDDGVPTARGGARWYQGTVRSVLRSVALDREYAEAARRGAAARLGSGDGRAARRITSPRPPAPVLASNGAPDPGTTVGHDAFIGRRRELEELAGLLRTERLLTLVGPPGVGKTRLAVELASRSRGRGGRVLIVELAALTDPRLVSRAVASALGLWDRSGWSLTDLLVAHLRDRELLLVLDTCEHLAGHCAELAARIATSAGAVSILATSQVPLGFDGERVWTVPPLRLPEPSAPPGDTRMCEAVALFAERAREVHRSFVWTEETLAAATEICRRLDGNPLAIELAAARVSVLTPAEIAARLDDRFGLLTGGRRVSVGRHETLRGALDWSHELLTSDEQALLRRLSAFAGGGTIDAVHEVCRESEARDRNLVDRLGALVAKSLVVVDGGGPATRYRLLDTVRAYAQERLAAAGEVDDRRDRHAAWYRRLAERAERGLTGMEQQRWVRLLEADHDNLRSALSWAIDRQDARTAIRIAGSLSLFWRIRGHLQEGRRWLDLALALPLRVPKRMRAKALWGAGFLALMFDDQGAAQPLLEEGLKLAREAGYSHLVARSLLLLGNLRLLFSGPAEAMQHLRPCVDASRENGDRWCLAHGLALMGRAHILLGDPRSARCALEESLGIARAAKDHHSLCISLNLLGYLALKQGHCRSAATLLEEALDEACVVGDLFAMARARQWLGQVAEGRGDYARAADLLGHALTTDMHVTPGNRANILGSLGRVSLAQGDWSTARSHFEEAAAWAARSGDVLPAAGTRGLAQVALRLGELAVARRLIDRAVDHDRAAGDRHSTAASLHVRGQVARGEGDLARAHAAHQESLEQCHGIGMESGVAFALEALAGVASREGRWEHAARLFGASDAIRREIGYTAVHERGPFHECDLTETRQVLGPSFDTIHAEGAALEIGEAVGRVRDVGGPRRRSATGWSSLTRAEEEVVRLAARGLTNAQIGAHLTVSPRTVARHLYHVFGKVGVNSRTELAREVCRRFVDA